MFTGKVPQFPKVKSKIPEIARQKRRGLGQGVRQALLSTNDVRGERERDK
jgi:hypothetical protein